MGSLLLNKKSVETLQNLLSRGQIDFLNASLNALEKVLPHVKLDKWTMTSFSSKVFKRKVWWTSINGQQRRALKLAIKFTVKGKDYYLTTLLKRLRATDQWYDFESVPSTTEFDLSKTGVRLIEEGIENTFQFENTDVIHQLVSSFEELLVLTYLKDQHKLNFDLSSLVDFLKILSEQSYENKSLSFGILIDKNAGSPKEGGSKFPSDFDEEKKYRVFSDGYKTSYLLNKEGSVIGLIDLESGRTKSQRGEHYYPQWSKYIAKSSHKGKIGFALTRQGDILYFENGSLKFTRRAGHWKYWNHEYIIKILRRKASAPKASPNILKKVVALIYRYSLDISFRHSGGLFLIIKNQLNLHEVVREGDGLNDENKLPANQEFNSILRGKKILGIDRNIMIELSSIDGAIVVANSGKLLAFGSVLSPKNNKGVNREQGSRSKAAAGASNYGVAVKISSDGDISFYQKGNRFLKI